MKKLFLVILIISIASAVFAQELKPKLIAPVDPAILGRGNTAIADPGGYQAFFYNPAGFAKDDQFTILSVNPWLFSDMNTIDLIFSPEAKADEIQANLTSGTAKAEMDLWLGDLTPTESLALLSEFGYSGGNPGAWFDTLPIEQQMVVAGAILDHPDFPAGIQEALGIPSGTARIGASMGVAFTGGGLGIGIFDVVDVSLAGSNIMAAEGNVVNQLTFHAGYAGTFDLGIVQIHAGAQARPTLIFNAPIAATFFSTALSATTVNLVDTISGMSGYAGIGIGLDVGVIVDFWWFNFGLSVMDLVSYMMYQEVNVGDVIDNPEAMIPTVDDLKNEEVINTTINFGLVFAPEIPVITDLIEPKLYIDFQDINGVITAASDGDEDALINLVKIGLDVRLLDFLKVSAGFADGSATLGAALELPFFNVSVAATAGLVESIDDISDFGIAAEIAVRF